MEFAVGFLSAELVFNTVFLCRSPTIAEALLVHAQPSMKNQFLSFVYYFLDTMVVPWPLQHMFLG